MRGRRSRAAATPSTQERPRPEDYDDLVADLVKDLRAQGWPKDEAESEAKLQLALAMAGIEVAQEARSILVYIAIIGVMAVALIALAV